MRQFYVILAIKLARIPNKSPELGILARIRNPSIKIQGFQFCDDIMSSTP